MIKKCSFPWVSKLALATLIIFIIIGSLQAIHPWQREPLVLYLPLILPVETVKGDILVFENGDSIMIERNMLIYSLNNNNGVITLKGTRRITLWEWLFERRDYQKEPERQGVLL